MRKLIKDPFIQFVILGGALFIGHGLWLGSAGEANTIRVSTETVERLKTIYAGEQRRVPSEDDVKALISAYVEEEALSREAQKLGLGEDDTIIRRRLAQKMRFMTENLGQPAEPTDSDLEAWFETHQDRFKLPTRLSFQHIYLSPENNTDLEARASKLRSEVQGGADWKSLGDPFIMSRSLSRVTQKDIERAYGGVFAKAIMDTPAGEWSAPLESAFGLHIVKISEKENGRQPSFEETRDAVQRDWLDAAQRENNAKKINEVISKYNIEMETKSP